MWLNLVSAARRAGDFRVLFPKGVKRIHDCPWPLMEAINHGLVILSWYENYLAEEIPNENLWDDGEAVEEHFKRLKERKDAEREGMNVADDGEEFVEGDAMSNDLASVFKQ